MPQLPPLNVENMTFSKRDRTLMHIYYFVVKAFSSIFYTVGMIILVLN